MRKPGLTPKRHLEIGSELAVMRDRLHTIMIEVMTAYPLGSRQAREAEKVIRAFSHLRSVLDSAACAEDDRHHQLGKAAIKAYYSPRMGTMNEAYVDAVARTGAVVVSREKA